MVMTSSQYRKKHGAVCPVCESPNINGGEVEISGSEAWANINCDACGASWCDSYRLTGYYDLSKQEAATPYNATMTKDI